jgi:glycine/D-amino acid oxidase-like deaminating enzyme
VHEDGPSGVTTGPQFTGATVKLEQFQKRYPSGSEVLRVGELELKRPTYFAREEAFLIHPPEYLAWLLDESCRCLPIEKYNDLVIGLERADVITLSTQRGERFSCDEVILCTGAATRFWRQLFPEGRLHSARPVQGAYFEFTGITGFGSSFSFTIDGDNLIYDAQRKTLLLGSTTADRTYELAHEAELLAVHERLSEKLSLKLPAPGTGTIRVGLREKAPRREPYCERDRNLAALGGFYKNGYTLSLLMAEKL